MIKIKSGFWLVPLFTGLTFIFAAGLHEPLLWFLFYLSAGIIVLTLVYRWRRWAALDISRGLSTDRVSLEAGADLRVVLRVKTFGLLPWPWLEITDNLPRSLSRHLQRLPQGSLFWARRNTMRHATYHVSNLPRGIHTWDSFKYRSGDLLGFIEAEGRIKKPVKLVVYPRTIELPALKFFPRRAEGAVMSRKNFIHSQTELVGIREYQAGDKLSLIDWKATAKTGHLFAKEFEPLLMSFSLIILDCTASVWGREFDPAFEEAVTVAASLVKAAVRAHIPARFHSNFTKQGGQIPVASWSEYYGLLARLADIDANGQDTLASMLHRELFIRDNNVVLISSEKGARLQNILHHLSVRGNSVTLILVGGRTASGPRLVKRAGTYNEIIIERAEELAPATAKRGVN